MRYGAVQCFRVAYCCYGPRMMRVRVYFELLSKKFQKLRILCPRFCSISSGLHGRFPCELKEPAASLLDLRFQGIKLSNRGVGAVRNFGNCNGNHIFTVLQTTGWKRRGKPEYHSIQHFRLSRRSSNPNLQAKWSFFRYHACQRLLETL